MAVEIKNTGAAPFYATWPPEVILVDENNKIVASQTIESTLPSILPGQNGRVTARLPLPPSKPARERPGPPDKGPRPLTASRGFFYFAW